MKTTELTEYDVQAIEFLKETGTTFKAEFIKNDFHFKGDKETRDIYRITLQRGARKFSFDFGQSINNSGIKIKNANTGKVVKTLPNNQKEYLNSKGEFDLTLFKYWFGRNYWTIASVDIIELDTPPTEYDVLTCLQKHDVGTFEDFCSDFGYETDSRTAKKTYKAVCKEFCNVQKLFSNEEIEKLQEIQ